MTSMSGFSEELGVHLRAVLGSLGALIADRVPGIAWHVELPASQIYDLVALLVFTAAHDRQTELVVVSVEFREAAQQRLTIDVTDRESVPLIDDMALREQCDAISMLSAVSAADDVGAILTPIGDRIVRELSP
jgi:hypothetical protein